MPSSAYWQGIPSSLDEVIHTWKSTAAIYADPKLAADLSRSLLGTWAKVPRP
jgi:hypothetical protein